MCGANLLYFVEYDTGGLGDSEQSHEGSDDSKAAHDEVIGSREQEDIVILYTIGLVGRVRFGLGRRALAPRRAWSRHGIDGGTGCNRYFDRSRSIESIGKRFREVV